MLAGASAAAAHGWTLPDVDASVVGPEVDGYLSELDLADPVERYGLEPDDAGDVVLRAVRQPWPFLPQLQLAPAAVVALDLAESHLPALAEVGRERLAELENAVEPSWRQRHAPKPPLSSLRSEPPPRAHARLSRLFDQSPARWLSPRSGTIGPRRMSSSSWRCSSSPPSRWRGLS